MKLPTLWLAACLSTGFMSVVCAVTTPGAAPAPATAVPAASPVDVAKSLGNAFAGVAERVSPSVVVITVTRGGQGGISGMPEGFSPSPEDQSEQPAPNDLFRSPHRMPTPPRDNAEPSQGSGFIVRPDGYIFTNNHVIQGADKIKVKLKDGRSFDAQVVGVPDEKTDVAVIKIDAKGLPAVEMGDSDAIRPGEWTIAIGAPFSLDYSVTVGVLSGKFRDHLGATIYEEYLQTQATINPGNSGGPLLDIDGKVVGINTLIRTRPGFTFYNANVGFAIPIKLAQKIGNLLITKGKVERPWIGVDIRTLEEATELKGVIKGVSKGVVIQSIRPDTPAYQSGLAPLDVITTIDGVAVNTARDLQKQVLEKKIGQVVRLNVMRNGAQVALEVKTGLQPSTQQISAPLAPTPQPLPPGLIYGLTVQPVTQKIIDQYSLAEKHGLYVVDVEEESPAARCGMEPGMVITEVDGRKVATTQALKDELKKADPKRGLPLQVSKGGIKSFVILRLVPSSRSDGD